MKALIVEKKRKLAAAACQKTGRDMPGERGSSLTGSSRRGSSRPHGGEQVGKELLDSLDHPRRSGILTLIEVQRWGTLLGHPAN